METEAEKRVFSVESAEGRRSSAKVEKMAYRSPGTVSVPAGVTESEGAKSPEAWMALEATVLRLEEALRGAERQAAAHLEEVRRAAREGAEQQRQQKEQELRTATETARKEVVAALQSFSVERERYFAGVEREVVRLALAIAARILHREALLDPTLLAGAVRVALGQLGDSTAVRLRCPAREAEGWRHLFAGESAPALEIVAEDALTAGSCVLETVMGSVDLGVRAQLEEIERGFFDLLEHRPPDGPIRSRTEGSSGAVSSRSMGSR